MNTSTPWMAAAECRDQDPSTFFPDGHTGKFTVDIEDARAICRSCPVLAACRDWSLETRQQYGIWGGITEQERRRILIRLSRYREETREEATHHVLYPRGTGRPIAEIFTERITVDADGHTQWRFQHSSFSINGRNRTPRQMAFLLAYGREPEGRTSALCGVAGCLTGDHIADDTIRQELAKQAAREAAAGPVLRAVA